MAVARPLRIEKAGGWYPVTARGHERKTIFPDDASRRHFLEVIAESVPRLGVRLPCFVLMDNHYHLLLELTEYIGLGQAPVWLECQRVLALGGGAKGQQRRRYREYVERMGKSVRSCPKARMQLTSMRGTYSTPLPVVTCTWSGASEAS